MVILFLKQDPSYATKIIKYPIETANKMATCTVYLVENLSFHLFCLAKIYCIANLVNMVSWIHLYLCTLQHLCLYWIRYTTSHLWLKFKPTVSMLNINSCCLYIYIKWQTTSWWYHTFVLTVVSKLKHVCWAMN